MKKAGPSSAVPSVRAEHTPASGVVLGGVIAGKYRVEREIGRGGMGVVVAASQLSLDRTVAIKLIRSEWAQDALAVTRLLREAKAAASIQNEHVARVLDVGTLESGAPFIVMEYLEGHDLDTLIKRDGPLGVCEAADFVLQACEAIAEAHRNGIVHRDLKPANLFVARQPGGGACIKVVDFGISKIISGQLPDSLTEPSRIVGSLYHMAPEQMRGKAVDARTDVWAIGVILFEMLTGQKPFREAAWPAVCAQILNESAPALGVFETRISAELEAVVQKCLRRAPADRYANVAELAVALSPFGSANARISLERIVRLATSTGSLSAESLTPTPPFSAWPAQHWLGSSESGNPTPIVPPSCSDLPASGSRPRSVSSALYEPSGSPMRALARETRAGWGVSVALLLLVALLSFAWRERSVPLPSEGQVIRSLSPQAVTAQSAVSPAAPVPPVQQAPPEQPAHLRSVAPPSAAPERQQPNAPGVRRPAPRTPPAEPAELTRAPAELALTRRPRSTTANATAPAPTQPAPSSPAPPAPAEPTPPPAKPPVKGSSWDLSDVAF